MSDWHNLPSPLPSFCGLSRPKLIPIDHAKMNFRPKGRQRLEDWKLGRKAIKTDTRTSGARRLPYPGAAAAASGRRLDQRHHQLGHDAERHTWRLHHRRMRPRHPGVDRQHRQRDHPPRLPPLRATTKSGTDTSPTIPTPISGGIELDVLNNWQKNGLAGHTLLAFADPSLANLDRDPPVHRPVWRRLHRPVSAAYGPNPGCVGCGGRWRRRCRTGQLGRPLRLCAQL